jgi:hypothetical protein
MKKLLLLLLVCAGKMAVAEDLPKDCLGTYAGEMAAYSVMKNDLQLNIEKHDVHVQITTHDIAYVSGNIELKGRYTFLKQSGTQYLIKATLSNGKSLAYQIDLLWDKKARSLFL